MPKPKRRLRPRNIILATIGLIALLVGYQVYLALTAKPGSAVDYAEVLEKHVIANQPVPTGEDAWPILLDAIARGQAAEEQVWPTAIRGNPGPVLDYSALYFERLKPTYDGASSWEAVDALALKSLDAVRASGAFDRLADMARAPRAVRPVPRGGRLIDILLPELGKCRNFARANGARMYLARQKGDDQEFIAAYEQTLALARVCAQQPLLIDHLVGIAIAALATNHLCDALTEKPFGPETCRALLAATDRQLPLAPFAYSLEAERIGMLDIIQWTHTDDGRGSGRFIPGSAAGLMGGGTATGGGGWLDQLAAYRIFNLAGLAYPSKAATTRKANEFYDQVAAFASLPHLQRRNATFNPDVWTAQLSARYTLLRTLVPAIGRAVQSRDQIDATLAGGRTLLAIELYRGLNGAYPESLDQLVPSILPALPIDPFTGRPLIYRLLKPGEPAPQPPAPESKDNQVPPPPQPARAFLLYSTGADGVDNGGNPGPRDFDAFRLPTGNGLDYIINTRRNRPAIDPPPPPPPEPAEPAEPDPS